MTPPINIDGTNENYSNVTIDGQDVTQITIDGQDVLSAIPDSGVARYEFEQDVTDSFNDNDATNNNVSFSSSTVKQGSFAAEYTASSGEEIVTPDLLPENNSPFSVVGFFFESSVRGQRYISEGNTNFSVFDDSNGNINVFVGGTQVVETSLDTGVWRHVGVTFDGAQARAYYDGTLIGTASTSTGTFSGLTIGNSASGGEPLDGFIDLLDFYDKELSSTEINNHKDTFSISG